MPLLVHRLHACAVIHMRDGRQRGPDFPEPVESFDFRRNFAAQFFFDRLKSVRSTLPAITHVDYSARIQTVERDSNPLLYELLLRFEKATGCGVLVNTSFNVRGEPIVCTPDDAYRCFMNTEIDYLVMGSFMIERVLQPRQQIPRHILPQAD